LLVNSPAVSNVGGPNHRASRCVWWIRSWDYHESEPPPGRTTVRSAEITKNQRIGAAILVPLSTVVLAGVVSSSTFPYWLNAGVQALAFLLPVIVGLWLTKGQAGPAIAIGLCALWALPILGGWLGTLRSGKSIRSPLIVTLYMGISVSLALGAWLRIRRRPLGNRNTPKSNSSGHQVNEAQGGR